MLQCFDDSLIERAQVVAVPLGSEDLRRGNADTPIGDRVAKIVRSIESLSVDIDIDYRDTLACVMIDGLSSSESFFMEALYDSGRFRVFLSAVQPEGSSISAIPGFMMGVASWITTR